MWQRSSETDSERQTRRTSSLPKAFAVEGQDIEAPGRLGRRKNSDKHWRAQTHAVQRLLQLDADNPLAPQQVEYILESRLNVSSAAVSRMVAVCSIQNDAQLLQRCIKLAKEQGVPLQASWYTCLLKAMYVGFCEDRQRGFTRLPSQDFRAVETDLKAAGLQPGHAAQRYLAAIHIITGDTSRAEGYLQQIRAQQGQLSAAACVDVVQAYAAVRLPDQAAAIAEEAMTVHGSFLSKKIVGILWRKVMHGYALAGKVSQMEQVVAKVRRLMPEQSIDTYGIRMEGYRFHGQYAMARAVMEEAVAAGHQPSAVMYTILLNAYGQAGMLQAAQAVIAEMQQAGLNPCGVTYTSLLTWVGQHGDREAAWDCWHKIGAGGMPPNQVSIYIMTEALMQHWWTAGKQPAHLAEAHTMFLTAQHALLSKHEEREGRPHGMWIDLHHYGRWSAQLAVLLALQQLLTRFCRDEPLPVSDLQLITGRGRSSRMANEGVVRLSVLRFLQGFTSPKLATRNEGMVTVRYGEILALLAAMRKSSKQFTPSAFVHCFAE